MALPVARQEHQFRLSKDSLNELFRRPAKWGLDLGLADLPGADGTVQQLKALFGDEDFHILAVSAIKDQGIDALVECIQELREKSFDNGNYQTKRLHLCRQELLSLLREKVFAKLATKIADGSFEAQVKRIAQGETDPYSAADRLARRIDTTRLCHNQRNISPQRRKVYRDRSIS